MQDSIELTIHGEVDGGAAHLSERTLTIAALFGLPIERGARRVLFEPLTLRVEAGGLVLITGPSGAGKSTLLNRIAVALAERGDVRVVRLEEIPLPADRSVIDCFPGSVDEAAAHLGRAGLAEAHIFLRAPAELSEGQRFRYRLARFFASEDDVLITDEFAAALDRVTARTVAHQVGTFVRRSVQTNHPRAVLVATTHEDLSDDLRPTVRVYKPLGYKIEISGQTGSHRGHRGRRPGAEESGQ
jgi:ABC-type ATPase with predicted acetyltransferase domain